MNLTFMQFFSKHFGVIAGKINTLGGDDNAFAHDYHSTFMNSALNFNVALALVPFTGLRRWLRHSAWDGAIFTVSVIDPSGTATNNDISDAFNDGVLVAAEGRVTITPFGLVGHQLLGGVWSNKERLSLEQNPSNLARLLLTQRFCPPGRPWPGPESTPGALLPVPPRPDPADQPGERHVVHLL